MRLARHLLALRPAHSRRHLYVTCDTEGFSHFVTSLTAPVASGWSVRRVGLAPTGKRRLLTAHANSGHSTKAWRKGQTDLGHYLLLDHIDRKPDQLGVAGEGRSRDGDWNPTKSRACGHAALGKTSPRGRTCGSSQGGGPDPSLRSGRRTSRRPKSQPESRSNARIALMCARRGKTTWGARSIAS